MVSLVSPIPPYLGTQAFKCHPSAPRTPTHTDTTLAQHTRYDHTVFLPLPTMARTAMEALTVNGTLLTLLETTGHRILTGFNPAACLNTGSNNKKLINPVRSLTFSTFYHQKMILVYLVMVDSWHRDMLAIFDQDNFLNWIRICLYLLRDITNSSFMYKRYMKILWLTKSEHNILLANNLACKPMNFRNEF